MSTVLVCEDEFALLNVIALELEAAGFSVRRAGDGETALGVLREAAVDLVLADSRMPGLGGLSVLDELGRAPALRGVRFLLMLAAHERLTVVGLRVLRKPFTVTEMLDAVRAALSDEPP